MAESPYEQSQFERDVVSGRRHGGVAAGHRVVGCQDQGRKVGSGQFHFERLQHESRRPEDIVGPEVDVDVGVAQSCFDRLPDR